MPITSDFIAGLPDPDIVETLDVEAMITAMRDDLVGRFPSIVGVIDLESEPARILIEVFAYRELLVRARVNDATRSNLVAYATGTDLDHLAGFYDVSRLESETDDALRSRTILAIRGRSTAGPEARYEFIARSADVRVKEVLVYKGEGGPTVSVAVTSTDNGGVADEALLSAVSDALNATDVRVVSDVITVHAAVNQTIDIVADVWLHPTADIAAFNSLESLLRAAWVAEGGIGRDLNLSWVTRVLMAPGVARVAVMAPAERTIVPYNQAISIGTVTLTNRGRER